MVKVILTDERDERGLPPAGEVHVLANASWKEDTQHCVARFRGFSRVPGALQITTEAPGRTMQQRMQEFVDNALPLKHWVRFFLRIELQPEICTQRCLYCTIRTDLCSWVQLWAAKKIARALATLHANGIVYLHLHPSTIDLAHDSGDAPARLLDFCRASLSCDAGQLASVPAARVTPGNVALLDSVAPELVANNGQTSECPAITTADTWGFGVLMLHAWLGRSPLEEIGPEEGALLLARRGELALYLACLVEACSSMPNGVKNLLVVRTLLPCALAFRHTKTHGCMRAQPIARGAEMLQRRPPPTANLPLVVQRLADADGLAAPSGGRRQLTRTCVCHGRR